MEAEAAAEAGGDASVGGVLRRSRRNQAAVGKGVRAQVSPHILFLACDEAMREGRDRCRSCFCQSF